MKNILLGIAVGAALGYLGRIVYEHSFCGDLDDDVNEFAGKAKRKVKDVMAKGRNHAEYIKDRANYKIEKGKAKLDEALDQ